MCWQETEGIFRLSSILLQDLLVDCFKPTEVSFFPPSLQLNHRTFCMCVLMCLLSLLPPRRTSSQSCSIRSEGCRSSPRLRRNDPPSPSNPKPSPPDFLPTFSSFNPLKTFFSSLPFLSYVPLFSTWIQLPGQSLCLFFLHLLQKRRSKIHQNKQRFVGLNPGARLPPRPSFTLRPTSPLSVTPPCVHLRWSRRVKGEKESVKAEEEA